MKLSHPTHWAAGVLGTTLLLAQTSRALDFVAYDIVREEWFTQATTNRASTDAAARHGLGAYVSPSAPGTVTSASIRVPSGWVGAMTDNGQYYYLPTISGHSIDLPATAPAGIYQFAVVGANDGLRRRSLTLPAPATGIAPARIANFPEAQLVDATQDFEVRWDKIPRRGPGDGLFFHVVGPDNTRIFDSGIISLDTTNLIIPAGTLQPNTTNGGYLYIRHYFSRSVYPQYPAWAVAEDRSTRFTIKTLNPNGVFSFSRISRTARETDGTATITVVRTQGSEGDATVDYFSDDATAKSNVNYVAVSGTLKFAPGETNQTFTVQLLNDGVTNPPLSAHFTLTNATGGAALVVRPHANLTILDSESPPPPNVTAFHLAMVEFYSQTNSSVPTQAN